MKDIINAHKFSSKHKITLLKDKICGCFYCCRIFSPSEIKEWIDDGEDHTAVCPYCNIDSIIGESSGYPITKEFINKMYQHWFT